MLNSEAEKLTIEKGLTYYKRLTDIDGPGVGNSAIEERAERPKEGGVYIYAYGYKYPYKGSPDVASVEQFRYVKKLILFMLLAVKNRVVMVSIGLITLMPNFIKKHFFRAIVTFFDPMIYWLLYYVYLKPDKYCICVRELYRAFNVIKRREKDEYAIKAIRIIRDVFCLFIEQDSAYKFRFQDIMAEVDTYRLRRGGIGMADEILRLMHIMKDREVDKKTMSDYKWVAIEKLIKPAFLIKEVRHYFHEFVKEVDFNKLEPDEGDWYYDTLRLDYDFGGKLLPQRIEERKAMDRENWDKYNFDELARLFLIEYNNRKGALNDGKNNIAVSN